MPPRGRGRGNSGFRQPARRERPLDNNNNDGNDDATTSGSQQQQQQQAPSLRVNSQLIAGSGEHAFFSAQRSTSNNQQQVRNNQEGVVGPGGGLLSGMTTQQSGGNGSRTPALFGHPARPGGVAAAPPVRQGSTACTTTSSSSASTMGGAGAAAFFTRGSNSSSGSNPSSAMFSGAASSRGGGANGSNGGGGDNNSNNVFAVDSEQSDLPTITIVQDQVAHLRNYLAEALLTPLLRRAAEFRARNNNSNNAGDGNMTMMSSEGQLFDAQLYELRTTLQNEAQKREQAGNPLLNNNNSNNNKDKDKAAAAVSQQTTTSSFASVLDTVSGSSAGCNDPLGSNSYVRVPLPIEVDLLQIFAAAPCLSAPMAVTPEATLKTVSGEVAAIAELAVADLRELLTQFYELGPTAFAASVSQALPDFPYPVRSLSSKRNNNNNNNEQQPQQQQEGEVNDNGESPVLTGCLLHFWKIAKEALNLQHYKWEQEVAQLSEQLAQEQARLEQAQQQLQYHGGGCNVSSSSNSSMMTAMQPQQQGMLQLEVRRYESRVRHCLEQLHAAQRSEPPLDPLPIDDVPYLILKTSEYRSMSNICLRPTHCPPCFAVTSHDLNFLRHNGRLVMIRGTVIKNSAVKLVVYKSEFVCNNCGGIKDVYTSLATRQQALTRPYCSSCKKERVRMQLRSESLKDYVECWLQRQSFGEDDQTWDDDELFAPALEDEQHNNNNNNSGSGGNKHHHQRSAAKSGSGSGGFSAKLPRSILVALEDDLARSVYPGVAVSVIGVCVARWAQMMQNQTPEVSLMVSALNVQHISAAQLSQSNPSSISARQQALLMMARRLMMHKQTLKQSGGSIGNSNKKKNKDQQQQQQQQEAEDDDYLEKNDKVTWSRKVKHELRSEVTADVLTRLDEVPVAALLTRLVSPVNVEEQQAQQQYHRPYVEDGPFVGFDETALQTQWVSQFIISRFMSDPAMNDYETEYPDGNTLVTDQNSIFIDKIHSHHHHQQQQDDGGGNNSAGAPRSQSVRLLLTRETLRTKLVQSVAPQLCGRFAERLSVLLAVIGGVRRRPGGGIGGGATTTGAAAAASSGVTSSSSATTSDVSLAATQAALRPQAVDQQQQQQPVADSSAVNSRTNVHLLFVGDPSTGKSQLLLAANKLALTGVYAMGIGTTSAGLTAAATKEGGEWTLEPGALVLSNGGVCVIDELRTVSASDRNSLHEAMEQQSISVAKAGMCATLRTDCSVIAACNPVVKGRRGAKATAFDPTSQREIEVGIGAPLLSRFDLIFTMFDSTRYDDYIASHILQLSTVSDEILGASAAEQEDEVLRQQQQRVYDVDGEDDGNDDAHQPGPALDYLGIIDNTPGSSKRQGINSLTCFTTKQLREYCIHCRQRCHQQKSMLFGSTVETVGQAAVAAAARGRGAAAAGGGSTAFASAGATQGSYSVAGGATTTTATASQYNNSDSADHHPHHHGASPATLTDLSLDNDAASLLLDYYNIHRADAADGHSGSMALADHVLVTIRLLESLIRLTQAHACLVGRAHSCTGDDAAMAVLLTEQSARSRKLRLFDELTDVDPQIAATFRQARTESERNAILSSTGLSIDEQIALSMPYSNSNCDRWFLNVGTTCEYAQRVILYHLQQRVQSVAHSRCANGSSASGGAAARLRMLQQQQQQQQQQFGSDPMATARDAFLAGGGFGDEEEEDQGHHADFGTALDEFAREERELQIDRALMASQRTTGGSSSIARPNQQQQQQQGSGWMLMGGVGAASQRSRIGAASTSSVAGAAAAPHLATQHSVATGGAGSSGGASPLLNYQSPRFSQRRPDDHLNSNHRHERERLDRERETVVYPSELVQQPTLEAQRDARRRVNASAVCSQHASVASSEAGAGVFGNNNNNNNSGGTSESNSSSIANLLAGSTRQFDGNQQQ